MDIEHDEYVQRSKMYKPMPCVLAGWCCWLGHRSQGRVAQPSRCCVTIANGGRSARRSRYPVARYTILKGIRC